MPKPIIHRFYEFKHAWNLKTVGHKSVSFFGKLIDFLFFIKENKISFIKKKVDLPMNASLQFRELADWIKVNIDSYYIYPYDGTLIRSIYRHLRPIASITPDYSKILSSNLETVRNEIFKCQDDKYKKALNKSLEATITLLNRIIMALKKETDNTRTKELLPYFINMFDKPVQSFDEALQRILFYNSMFWQNGIQHNGIGRLDLILCHYYEKDIKEGVITRKSAKTKLINFINILAKDTKRKSAAFIGDTGQVIILGGIDQYGRIIENEITYMLLEIFSEHPVPDPKLLFRVNKHTRLKAWDLIVASILKGSGSPLIINEDKVIPLLNDFGYETNDTWNFGTSACWEPLIIGKSFDQNNAISNIIILDALSETIHKSEFKTFEDFLADLNDCINKQINKIDTKLEFDKCPFLSMFIDGCIEKGIDIGDGGAKYNFHGLLVVGLPNIVNAVLNIREVVFNKKILNIKDLVAAVDSNYEKAEDILYLLLSNTRKFGSTDPDVIRLTNQITSVIDSAMKLKTMKGKPLKVGFSSPGYIELSKRYPASLDGRKKGDPFAVHISPISSKVDISEVLNFAAKLDYGGSRINGNVVDFILPMSYTSKPEQLALILKDACQKGVFELQLNVLNKEKLIQAKKHPEMYPELIVRVWGFSAYYSDLPEDYKDYIIARSDLYI